MLIALASIIIAIVFSFRAYYAAEEQKIVPSGAENIRIAGILVASALALTVLGVVISFFMYGTMAVRSPKNVLGSNILFMGLALIIGILMIVALVYAWIAYTDTMKSAIAVDVLIAAIAITVAIVSPFFSKGGLGSVPIIGDTFVINPSVNINDSVSMDETMPVVEDDNISSILIPKLNKKK
jgi:hypothetical protein